MGEQEGRVGRIADQSAVRAAVGQAGDRGGVGHHLVDGVVVALHVVEERQHQHGRAIRLEHEVVHGGQRVLAAAAGDGADRLVRGRFVVRRVADRVDAVGAVLDEGEQRVEQRDRLRGQVRLGQDRGAHTRVGQPSAQFAIVEFGLELPEGRPVGEGVVAGEAEQHAERAGGELRVHPDPVVEGPPRDVELLAPQVGGGLGLHHRERQRAVDLRGEPDHPVQLLQRAVQALTRGARRCDLEHRLTAGRHRPSEREQFILGGIRPRHRFAVDGPVRLGARGRKAQRPSLDRLLHDACHRGDVIGGGGLVAGTAIAHRIAPHRAVGDLGAEVDGQLLLLHRVEVLRKALPAPGDALGERGPGDVLDTLHQLDEPLLAARLHGGETDAAVAADDRRHTVHAGRLQQAVPADLAVVVGVDVDEARGDDAAGGIDRLRRLPLQSGAVAVATTNLDDPAVLDPDVGPERLVPGAVDDGAAGDRQVVHAASSTGEPTVRVVRTMVAG